VIVIKIGAGDWLYGVAKTFSLELICGEQKRIIELFSKIV